MGTPPVTPAPYTMGPPPPSQPGWWSRNWKWFVPVGCLGLIAIFVALGVGIVWFGLGMMRDAKITQLAFRQAQQNPIVQQKLGTPITMGRLVSGSINEAGTSGEADITIPISGPNGQGTLYVQGKEFANEWTVTRMEFQAPGEDQRINLLPPHVEDQ